MTQNGKMEGHRILIIDDDPDICRLLQLLFSTTGALVKTATSATEGLSRLRSLQPDLVLVDLLMPGVDGCQLIRQINEQTCAPILVLSGMADPDSIASGLDCGAADYVTKPFSAAVLLARARAALRQASSRSAGYRHGKLIPVSQQGSKPLLRPC